MTLQDSLNVPYKDEIRSTLISPEFWELRDPCQWNATNYLLELYDRDPLLAKSSAYDLLLKDARTMKALVSSNTVAESMLNAICEFDEKNLSEAVLKKWNEAIETIQISGLQKMSTKVKKTVLKSSMMEEISFEEKERVRKKAKTDHMTSINRGVESSDEEENDSIFSS